MSHRRGSSTGVAVGVLVASLGLAACTGSADDDPSSRSARASASAVPSFALAAGPTCATPRAEPDPHRPRMTLDLRLSDDHRTVTGTEHLVFTPDLPITELVFRLAANARETVAGGNGITVTSASADHGAGPPVYASANAAPSSQGGLLHLPFARRVPAGTTVTADLAFTVTLGKAYFDRFGRAGDFAYLGSAEPLLAWQDGVGWHTEDLSALSSETTTSEAMDVDLTVTAPGADTVLMSGDPADPAPASAASAASAASTAPASGPRTWHSHVDAARDVSVAAGPFVVSDAMVGDVRVRVGTPTAAPGHALVEETARAITELSHRFGPYPFDSLSVALLPAHGGGIEYPSSILLFGPDRYLVVHEVAHQWFYAMLGNSQARHPWLDEAFAEYAEELVDDSPDHPKDLERPGRVDSSTESFGAKVYPYFNTIYLKGSEALRTARDRAGADAFDAALRCYVAADAWRIVEPADLARALAGLPAALEVLRDAGALRSPRGS